MAPQKGAGLLAKGVDFHGAKGLLQNGSFGGAPEVERAGAAGRAPMPKARKDLFALQAG
jgi:hypothetical protein